MSELDPVDQARRRLALMLLGTPMAGALHAAPVAPTAATEPTTDGAAHTGRWVHGFAAFGPPKYGPDFQHFDYVNPDAPKGGTLRLQNPDRRSSFDKFNLWTVRGNAPAGLRYWMLETLGHLSQDEPMTVYGLLAEALFVEPDFSAVTFRLRPEARFSSGDPVTAEDVSHSFAMLSGKGADPSTQTKVAAFARVLASDTRTVRFEFKDRSREAVFTAAKMPVFSRKWVAGKPFDQVTNEVPIFSGPYVLGQVEMPRRIEFKRNPDYWGWKLPVRRGHFNFDRVVYRMYADNAVAREAFKAGEFDFYRELRGRAWAREHQGPKWDSGRIVKAVFPTAFGQNMQSYIMNMRRPMFADMRVRQAIGLTYDFETVNKLKLFKRANSQFNNTEFAAQGLPGPGELKLLEPFRAELPSEVFGPAYVAPRTDGEPKALRRNLLKARGLLEAAGWKLDPAGVLRNAKGEPFEFEYLTPGDGSETDWQGNLTRLGIKMKLRNVDFALYSRRLEQYDFDLVAIALPPFTLPDVKLLSALFSSKSADEPGNDNYRGVKSKAADSLMQTMGRAQTLTELRDAARALDRIITHSHWQVPHLYKAEENMSYWNRFGRPKVQAQYMSAEGYSNGFVEWDPWALLTWWDKALGGQAAAKSKG